MTLCNNYSEHITITKLLDEGLKHLFNENLWIQIGNYKIVWQLYSRVCKACEPKMSMCTFHILIPRYQV